MIGIVKLSTTDPHYYKWTQWIFLKLYEKGLAYIDEVPVNWCPALGTVLQMKKLLMVKVNVAVTLLIDIQ